MYSIEKMKKAARRRLKRLAQRSRDAGVVRRALTILRLGEEGSVALVAEQVSAARSSVYRWQAAYREAGADLENVLYVVVFIGGNDLAITLMHAINRNLIVLVATTVILIGLPLLGAVVAGLCVANY